MTVETLAAPREKIEAEAPAPAEFEPTPDCSEQIGFTALCGSCPLLRMLGDCPKAIREARSEVEPIVVIEESLKEAEELYSYEALQAKELSIEPTEVSELESEFSITESEPVAEEPKVEKPVSSKQPESESKTRSYRDLLLDDSVEMVIAESIAPRAIKEVAVEVPISQPGGIEVADEPKTKPEEAAKTPVQVTVEPTSVEPIIEKKAEEAPITLKEPSFEKHEAEEVKEEVVHEAEFDSEVVSIPEDDPATEDISEPKLDSKISKKEVVSRVTATEPVPTVKVVGKSGEAKVKTFQKIEPAPEALKVAVVPTQKAKHTKTESPKVPVESIKTKVKIEAEPTKYFPEVIVDSVIENIAPEIAFDDPVLEGELPLEYQASLVEYTTPDEEFESESGVEVEDEDQAKTNSEADSTYTDEDNPEFIKNLGFHPISIPWSLNLDLIKRLLGSKAIGSWQ